MKSWKVLSFIALFISISGFKSISGIGFGCNKESERVMRLSNKWNPGFKDGIAVKVKMTLPFIFKLSEKSI